MEIRPADMTAAMNAPGLDKKNEQGPQPGNDSVAIGGNSRSGVLNKVDPSLINDLFKERELPALWSVDIPFSGGGGNAILPMEDGRVCLGSYRRMRSLDGKTGSVVWEREVDKYYFGGEYDSQYMNGRIFLKSSDVDKLDNDHIVILDAADGAEKWRHRMDKYSGIRITEEGDVFLNQQNGFAILDSNDGSEKKKVTLDSERKELYTRFIAIRKDGTMLAANPEHTFALGPDGKVLWKDDGSSFDNAFFVGDRALIGGPKGGLIMKDLNTGAPIWSDTKWLMRANYVSRKEIYASCIYELKCLDLADGHEKWSIPGEQENYSVVKAMSPEGIPFVARGNRIEALDPDTGAPRWTLPLSSEQLERRSSARLEGERLFLNDGGKIYIIDTKTGLKLGQYGAEDNYSITNFRLAPDGNLLVQAHTPKDRSYGSAKLHCIELDSKCRQSENGAPDSQSTIEEIDNWVVIGGMKLPRQL